MDKKRIDHVPEMDEIAVRRHGIDFLGIPSEFAAVIAERGEWVHAKYPEELDHVNCRCIMPNIDSALAEAARESRRLEAVRDRWKTLGVILTFIGMGVMLGTIFGGR